MHGINILGTGSYVPPFEVTNEDLSSFMETSDEWISSRTGIKSRRFNTDHTNYYMATQAAKSALENSGVSPEDIDMIIVSTCTPDFFYPSMSCLVQHEIGAVNAAAIDVSSACTGFITALDVAQKYLATEDNIKKILVIASERLTPHADFTDRATCVLFADGAGAAVIERSEKLFCSFLGAEGDPLKSLYCKVNYDINCPYLKEEEELKGVFENENQKKYIQMDGKGVYKFAVDAMPKAANAVLEKAGLTFDDIDIVIPHQANIRIIKTALKAMKIDESKVVTNLEYRGNTSSACIPSCIDILNREGKLIKGKKLLIVGFGAGLTYGAIVLEI